MDLQRVEFLSSAFARLRAGIKDLGQFYGSCEYHGVKKQDWDLWVHHYFEAAGTLPNSLSRRNSAKMRAAVARWELRQWRRRMLNRFPRPAA